jgi:hypothetical protein
MFFLDFEDIFEQFTAAEVATGFAMSDGGLQVGCGLALKRRSH